MANAVAGHKRAHETYIDSLDIDYIFSIMKHFQSSKKQIENEVLGYTNIFIDRHRL